jgi:hypothetical protein
VCATQPREHIRRTSVAQQSPHHGPPAGLRVDGGGRRPRRSGQSGPQPGSPAVRPPTGHTDRTAPVRNAPARKPPRPAAATQPMTPPQPELQHRPKSMPRTRPRKATTEWSTRSGLRTTHTDAAPTQHDFPGPSPYAGVAASPATPAATAGRPWCSSARVVGRWGCCPETAPALDPRPSPSASHRPPTPGHPELPGTSSDPGASAVPAVRPPPATTPPSPSLTPARWQPKTFHYPRHVNQRIVSIWTALCRKKGLALEAYRDRPERRQIP